VSWASSDADMQERPTELTEEVAGSPATAEEATGHWYLRPRASGDVLMAEAGVNEITVVLFAATVDLAWSQLQDRLQDILEEALRASRDVPGPQVIPPLLHYTVRGLLQWKEELEAAAEDTIFWSLVFFNSVTAPAVVHIGGDQPALMAGDRPLVPRSLILRGRQGSTARALCLHPGRLRRISLAWSPLCPSTKSISASVQAEWVHELPDQGKTEPSGLVGLLDRVISRLGQGAKSRSDPAEREVADPTPSDSTESRPDAGEGFPALVGAEA
jgi:hypothetical protein